MGVSMLTKFVDVHPELLTDHRLHDTRLIVDGNNLYHFLYHYFQVSCQCGGDYDTFADKVRYFFGTLRRCRIHAYVVFDGAYDEDDIKLRTIVKRAATRIVNVEPVVSGAQLKVLPILTADAFHCILDDLGIDHVTFDFEADQQIAALAKRWRCAVMSNDSDFFVYDMPGGYIPLDYVNLLCHHVHETKADGDETIEDNSCKSEDCAEGYYFVDVQVFYLDSLLKKYNITVRQNIALFATLQGNDYASRDEFSLVFSKIRFPAPNKKLKKKSVKLSDMDCMLRWFQGSDSFKKTVDTVMVVYGASEKQAHVKSLMDRSLAMYLDMNSCLSELFEKEQHTTKALNPGGSVEIFGQKVLTTRAGSPVPAWLLYHLHRGRISPQCLNILIHRRLFLLSQIEVMTLTSSYHTSTPVRQLLYGILSTLDLSVTDYPHLEKAKLETCRWITEYDRIKKQLKKNRIDPVFLLPNEERVPHLLNIPDMPTVDKENWMRKMLNIPEEFQAAVETLVPKDLQLVLYTVLFWARHADPAITDVQLRVLIVCLVKLYFLDQPEVAAQYAHVSNISENQRQVTSQSLKKYVTARRFGEDDDKFDCAILHGFAQFQGCLSSVIMLHQVFLCPFGRINPVVLLNGSLFYNMCDELKTKTDPHSFMDDKLIKKSTAQIYCKRIFDSIVAHSGTIKKETTVVRVHKNKKKKKSAQTKKKKNKQNEKTGSASEHDLSEDDDECKMASVEALRKAWDINLTNKFRMLEVT